MFEQIFCKVRNVLHVTLIPVVHAKETVTKEPTDESVWDRLKATTHRK